MPVRRLRSLDEAEQTLWQTPGDPRLWQSIAAVWGLARRLSPPHFPPGVYKHRSVESLNRQTERWETEHVDALRRNRR
jgi:hypothetical protein